MEEELESKTFYRKDYKNADIQEEVAEKFAKEMRQKYPDDATTKEYVHSVDILVRVTKIRQLYRTDRILERERQKERVRQREREIGRGGGRSRSR